MKYMLSFLSKGRAWLRSVVSRAGAYVRSHSERWPEVVMAVFTVGIFLYAFVQSGIAAKQTEIAGRQTRILELQQRPWVGPIISDGGPTGGVSVLLKNGGQGPALHVTNSVRISPPIDPQKQQFTPGPDLPPESVSNILPGDAIPAPARQDRPLTPDELAQVLSGTLRLYLYGTITYYDASHREHQTLFEYYTVPSGKPSLLLWITAPNHNEMN